MWTLYYDCIESTLRHCLTVVCSTRRYTLLIEGVVLVTDCTKVKSDPNNSVHYNIVDQLLRVAMYTYIVHVY